MINQKEILRLTVYGLNIYAFILGCYYKQGIVLEFDGKKCKPARNPFNGDKETLLVSDCFVPCKYGLQSRIIFSEIRFFSNARLLFLILSL